MSYADAAENYEAVEGRKPPRYNVELRYFVARSLCIYSKKWCTCSQVHGSTRVRDRDKIEEPKSL